MTITLYDATVPNFLQQLSSLRGVLDKGLAHAKATGLDPQVLVEAKLIDDMFTLRQQIQLVAHHSRSALDDVSAGAFSMPRQDSCDYAELQHILADAETGIRSWTREAVNALEGREVIFDIGKHRTLFTAEAFLFSVSKPNFYFHTVTAYDILRARGVPLGKRDYLGQTRTKLA